MSTDDASGFWEERYGERDRIWSGRPNQALVESVGGIRPGKALDLGCGEGADSVWLAEQGWRVTAIDISATAISRAEAAAAERGIADNGITWLVQDLSRWHPTDSYDLVVACFLHSPVELPRTALLRQAASAVQKGGHLLVVGHAEAPSWAEGHEHAEHRFLGPDEEIAELDLDASKWDTVISEVRTRQAPGPDGNDRAWRDGVVLLRRVCRQEPATRSPEP